jgi:hypothetical protein
LNIIYLPSHFICNELGGNAYLHFYPEIQQKEVRVATTLLNSMCVAVPVLTAPTSGFDVFLCIPKDGAKNAILQCMNFIYFKLQ